MNRTLLLKVKEQILKEPARFIMSDWNIEFRHEHEKFDDYGVNYEVPKCGTMACIGGWTCVFGLSLKKLKEVEQDGTQQHYAQELLGISDGETLFHVDDWPEDLRTEWNNAKTPRARAKVAARRIDRFILQHCGA